MLINSELTNLFSLEIIVIARTAFICHFEIYPVKFNLLHYISIMTRPN